ncbi:phage fiber-tail adaptor protein [Pseudokordiimonas caeni]|uniref:phage fiber-tail adaptor protein n=1 Tax=Pseudokordiimonas caeni TaxID=2997908 RepID=UPI002811B51A|nr:hypothetical protein [Pseudokordiimonas caeni]
MSFFAKSSEARLDYSVDWADWLTGDEAVSEAAWSVTPDEDGGISLDNAFLSGSLSGVFAEGGVPGHRYRLTCRVETDAMRVGERTMTLLIAET